jgi:hypothetical protein
MLSHKARVDAGQDGPMQACQYEVLRGVTASVESQPKLQIRPKPKTKKPLNRSMEEAWSACISR